MNFMRALLFAQLKVRLAHHRWRGPGSDAVSLPRRIRRLLFGNRDAFSTPSAFPKNAIGLPCLNASQTKLIAKPFLANTAADAPPSTMTPS